ncbi:SGNH/GDSL hydrolase family protein [Kitasatospora sp. NPDC002040]|uniref:SGNH/GDSL hydrolase family protein n=1 Tax=Kitasatospora sp. NPDC002040 TaxID=3154661 RepID=UPI003325B570
MAGMRFRRLGSVGAAAVLALGAVTVPAQAAKRPGPAWAALGDSYTAGVVQAAGAEFEQPGDGCARTDLSYPELIARELGPLVSLRNVSCGGAKVADVEQAQQAPSGRPLPPLGADPDAPFAPVPPQLDAVSPDTGLVTVGIGGNSLGFGPILTECLTLGALGGGRGTPCRDKLAAGLPGRLEQLAREYDAMLTALHAKAPSARVITVGYPQVIPADTGRCGFGDPLGFGTMTAGDLAWARTDILDRLNAVIAKSTADHGDTFVDLYPSTEGHTVCDRAGGNNWVDGIMTSVLPLSYAFVHPNAKGHANAAALVGHALLGS